MSVDADVTLEYTDDASGEADIASHDAEGASEVADESLHEFDEAHGSSSTGI